MKHSKFALIMFIAVSLAVIGCKKNDDNDPVPEKTVAEKIEGNWDVITFKEGTDDLLKYYVEDYGYDPMCGYYEYYANGQIEMFLSFMANGSYKSTSIATYDELYDYMNSYSSCANATGEDQQSEIIKGDWSLTPNNDKIVLDPEAGSAETYEIKDISEVLFELIQSTSNTELTMKRPD